MVKVVKKQDSVLAGVWDAHSGGNVKRYDLLGRKFEIYIQSFKMYIVSVPVIPLRGDYPQEIMGQAYRHVLSNGHLSVV